MNKQQAGVARRLIRRGAVPSISQVHQILSSLGAAPEESYVRTLVSLVATTGIRRSELCEARWCDVDFNYRFIRVHSKGQERKVPFGPKVSGLLRLQRDRDPESHYVLGSNPNGAVHGLCKTGLRYRDLRHFFLLHWVALGGDSESLAPVAGYSYPLAGVRFVGSPDHAFKITALHQAKIENELFKSPSSDLSEVSA